MKDQKEQSKFQAGLVVAGGLLFMFSAATEALFIIVDIVMLANGDQPSVGLLVGIAVVILISWGMVKLGKEKLGSALSQIATNLS